MPQWIGSLTSQNGNSLAGVFMINGEPWVFEKNARGQPAAPFQRAPAVVNIPWKELDSIRQSLQSCEPFTATIMGSTMEIVWSNGVRITANVPHCDTYGYFSGEGGWRTQWSWMLIGLSWWTTRAFCTLILRFRDYLYVERPHLHGFHRLSNFISTRPLFILIYLICW